MKQFCRYSGITLQHDTILDNLGLTRNKLFLAGEHAVFNRYYTIFDTVSMATFKPAARMTTDQRRLLFIAMLRHTGLVKVDWPVTQDVLSSDRILVLFPMMVDVAIRIASHFGEWQNLLPAMPRMNIRKDNFLDVDIPSYLAELHGRTQILLLPANLKVTKKTASELLGDEIDLEWQLKQQILRHRSDKKKTAFNVNVGKYVLNELDKSLKLVGKSLTEDDKAKAIYIFSTAKEKIKYGPTPIEGLRNLIVVHVSVGIAPSDTLLRSYTALTVAYLDNCLDYSNSITSLFGGITETVQAKLPSAYPTAYTVERAVTPANPFTQPAGAAIVVPKNPALAETAKTNPLLARILAKQNTVGGTNA